MIQGKQIESLDASKIITNDSMMFITKEKLNQIGICKVEMLDTKAQLPNIGLDNVLYVIKNDESKEHHPCIYIYKNNVYEIISGGSTDNSGGGGNKPNVNTFAYIKEITTTDWVTDGNNKVITIPASEHGQTTKSIVVMVFDGQEHVIIPYTVDDLNQVKVYSQSTFSGKIIVSDLVSHSHENIEVLNKFGQDENGGLLFSGEPIKGSGSGNPLMLEPLEYGYFTMSNDQTITENVYDVKFDIPQGNIPIVDGVLRLKAKKTYNISFGLLAEGNTLGGGTWCVYDLTNNKEISQSLHLIPVTYAGHYSNVDSVSCIITPDTDCDITIRRTNGIFNNKILKLSSHLVVQEIRNNPVNQYGGFETEVLFDGNGAVGKYTLSDDINNYDFLFITHEMKRDVVGKSIIPTMTSNTTPAPYVASASSEQHPAKGAFDGIEGSSTQTWLSQSGFPQWLNINCGSVTKVKSFSLVNGADVSGYAGYPPKTFKFQGSNNGVDYDDLLEVADLPKMGSKQEIVFELNKPVEYSQYRWYFTAGYNTGVIVGEAKLFGETISIENTNVIIPNGIKEHRIYLNDKSTIFSFDKNSLNISSDNGLNIKKITGVKGQLPTALVGGTF